jgi:hypothetical protein
MTKHTGFRSRAAIRQTAELAGQAYANKNGVAVLLFGVQGGYEARSQDRGAPKGSCTLLATLEPQKAAKAEKTEKERKPPTGRPAGTKATSVRSAGASVGDAGSAEAPLAVASLPAPSSAAGRAARRP